MIEEDAIAGEDAVGLAIVAGQKRRLATAGGADRGWSRAAALDGP
jgi:hypothetical protein